MNIENNHLHDDAAGDQQDSNEKKPILHKDIYREVTSRITPVVFLAIARNDHNYTGQRPSDVLYRLIAVREFLSVIRANGWSMGYANEQFFGYNGACWRELTGEGVKWCLATCAERMGVPVAKAWEPKFQDLLLEHFKAEAFLHGNAAFATNPSAVLVNLANGTYEISTSDRKLRGFNMDDNLYYQLPFSFTPNANAPMFMKFLDEVLPDKQCQAVLAEYIGYVFTRTSVLKLNKCMLLYGSGANGKSVLFDILYAMLGVENCCSYTLYSLTDDKGYARAKIGGKLVNYCSEISSKLDIEMFKILVSGEPVEARLPYKDPFNIMDYAKLMFNCNSLPKQTEASIAFFRRFIIIPFNVTIEEENQDKELANKIISCELPGVFNWVLDGLDRILKQKKFSECEAAEKAVVTYREESDSVLIFKDALGYTKSDEYVRQKDMYILYKKYCQRFGLMPLGIVNFGKRLSDLKITRKKLSFGMAVYLKPDIYRIQDMLNTDENPKM